MDMEGDRCPQNAGQVSLGSEQTPLRGTGTGQVIVGHRGPLHRPGSLPSRSQVCQAEAGSLPSEPEDMGHRPTSSSSRGPADELRRAPPQLGATTGSAQGAEQPSSCGLCRVTDGDTGRPGARSRRRSTSSTRCELQRPREGWGEQGAAQSGVTVTPCLATQISGGQEFNLFVIRIHTDAKWGAVLHE